MPMTERQKQQRNRWNKQHLRFVTLALHKEVMIPYEEYATKHNLTLAQTFITLAELQLGLKKRTFFDRLKYLFSK